MPTRPLRRMPAILAAGAITAIAVAGCSAPQGDGGDGEKVTLTWFMGAGVPDDIATAEQLAADFNAANDDVEVVVDASGPEGTELDNMVKTRLSTGEMSDLFWYNSGALMQALNPDVQLLNVAGEPWLDGLQDAYVTTVSTANGTYGAPVGQAMGGGIFYNIDVFEEAGVEVPQTWDEMLDAVAAIRGIGVDPVIQSYGDTWTSQMVVLADFYNIYAQDPDFGTKLTANEVKFADEPGLSSFEKLQDLADADAFNEDFATTLLDQALAKLANGEGAMYPMLTFAQATIQQNFPEQADSIGFFPVPGASADDFGLTTWMPSSVYAPATTEHPDEVKRFMAFVASPDGCDAITEARGITGPYVVDGCEIGGDVSRIVSDMLPFFEDGKTAPALEFLSPVKGPNLLAFTVELGSKITDAAQAAKAYDEDNALQAQQLGLEGW
ncbi:ABC transporter substrate-binding protein [Microbacterium sp. LjRoot45]|uniref:ABC transporter substrate-binding protein n=1 Tax=Microbacterium sp. LjRoot45 TaxID=3342329 RepID=UPI003ECF31DE